MGSVVDSNKAMRCEYIPTILHTAVSLLGDLKANKIRRLWVSAKTYYNVEVLVM
jgi:hypothetical protein